jgi:hypothetical protein
MERDWLRLPVVSAGAEYLVMGYLMRRNILTYKAPPNNEGYDLICIHPNPRHIPSHGELAQVRVQVKSRYATDCDRGFPVKETSFGAFDFLIVVFLNKPRHNFVYLSADLSQPYRFIVTPQICICGLFPSGSLVLPLCGGVAGEAGLE